MLSEKYCLKCEKMVIVEDGGVNGVEGHTEFIPVWDVDKAEYEIEFCSGPFTTSPAPDNFEEDWNLNLVEPSQEELAHMNLNAELLMQDLES